MTVIGYSHNTFNTKDGANVSGYFLYLTQQRSNVVGLASERVFVSDYRLQNFSYAPNVGDEIDLRYNNKGKVDYIGLLK